MKRNNPKPGPAPKRSERDTRGGSFRAEDSDSDSDSDSDVEMRGEVKTRDEVKEQRFPAWWAHPPIFISEESYAMYRRDPVSAQPPTAFDLTTKKNPFVLQNPGACGGRVAPIYAVGLHPGEATDQLVMDIEDGEAVTVKGLLLEPLPRGRAGDIRRVLSENYSQLKKFFLKSLNSPGLTFQNTWRRAEVFDGEPDGSAVVSEDYVAMSRPTAYAMHKTNIITKIKEAFGENPRAMNGNHLLYTLLVSRIVSRLAGPLGDWGEGNALENAEFTEDFSDGKRHTKGC